MTGALRMDDPDGVSESGQRVGKAGKQLATDWAAAMNAIHGAECGIGSGRLAGAFRPTYQQASELAAKNAATYPPRFAQLASSAATSVEVYTGLDNTLSNLLNGQTGLGG